MVDDSNLAYMAYIMLYPDKDPNKHEFNINYSGKFSKYNANVRYKSNIYDFSLSRDWIDISEEIKIGLIQSLMQKIFKSKVKTVNQDLYNSFLKNVHISIPKTEAEPELVESFNRVNDQYFLGTVEIPNLSFGQKSFSKLGSYQYGTDTISISQVFRDVKNDDKKLLDYVMFHEMLHKIHKFRTVNGRNMHHTRKFRFAESQFDDAKRMEEELKPYLRRKKFKHYMGID